MDGKDESSTVFSMLSTSINSSNFRIDDDGSRQSLMASAEFTAITPRSSRYGRQSLILRQMTVNKLKFKEDMLYGRDEEINQLKGVFQRCSSSNNDDDSKPAAQESAPRSRELVLLAGNAGTGKSALALKLRNTVRRAGGFYLSGKFDLQQSDEPYAAISAACRGLCQGILAHKEEKNRRWNFSYEELKEKIDEELGPDGQILTTVMPTLRQIISDDFEDDTSNASGYLKTKHRFIFAFRSFMRVICSFGPVVLTLDDLQWSDLASLELMQSLLTDFENKGGIMIVGIYRDDEVNDTHPLSKVMQDHEAATNARFGLSRILIGALNASHIQEMLADLMVTSADKTADLAECVHKKTLGNSFFVVQYLQSLVDKELLTYSLGFNEWTWEVDEIRANTMATDNAVDLMKEKLERLPPGIRDIIPMIACLGSNFRYPIFELVVEHFNEKLIEPVATEKDISVYLPDDFLNRCKFEGLIVDCGQEWFKWEHDKIQEAALSRVDQDELPSVQYEVGELLLARLSPGEVDDHLFVVANLLNQDVAQRHGDLNKRREIAKLNLRAGKNAIESSAFAAATTYFAAGVELLPANRWESEYALSLELYSAAAKAQYCVGNFELMKVYCDEVLAQVNHPFVDKRHAYNTLLHSIAAQGRMQEAQDLCVEVLAKLGCRFPKHGKTAYTIVGLLRTEMALKKTTEKIPNLPVITDDLKKWTMYLLDNLVTYTYQNDPALLPLAILKGHRYTIRYGLSEYAPAILSLVGLLLAGALGDFAGAIAYAENALALAEDHRDVQARTIFVSYQFVMHWQIATEMCKKPLLRGYTVGMKTGDTESACWCIYCYLEMTFHTAGSLTSLLRDCRAYSVQMEEVKQHKILSFLRILWQLSLSLTDDSPSARILTGDVLDEGELLRQIEETKDVHLKQQLDRLRMYAAFWFGDHETVVKTMQETETEKGDYEKTNPGTFGLCPLYFHCALSCISMVRANKHPKKYKKIAMKFAKKIKEWVKKGNPNITHCESLIDAELATLTGDTHLATKHYEVAILLASRRGFTSDHALSHERFADHRLEQDDTNDALYHYGWAIQLYEDWGASAKVAQLKSKHAALMAPPVEIRVSSTAGSAAAMKESTLTIGR
mmetsp:Transcript_8324/g.13779  ORF Transcript_8324/g.13779 Transcript_8324/m.13779 type:complete len:1123 (-) Transcript_8324:162-3530(-)